MNNFEHIPLVLNKTEGHNNGGRFFYSKENGVEVEEGRKRCDLGVINVPISDIEDYTRGLFGCCVNGTIAYLALAKVRRSDLNTNAVYSEVVNDVRRYPKVDHAVWATEYKRNYPREDSNGNKPALVDVYAIQVGNKVSNTYGNDRRCQQTRQIIVPLKDPKFVDFANGEAFKLESELQKTTKHFIPGDTSSGTYPIFTLRYRFVHVNTIVSIRAGIQENDDTMAKLAAATASIRVIEDDEGA